MNNIIFETPGTGSGTIPTLAQVTAQGNKTLDDISIGGLQIVGRVPIGSGSYILTDPKIGRIECSLSGFDIDVTLQLPASANGAIIKVSIVGTASAGNRVRIGATAGNINGNTFWYLSQNYECVLLQLHESGGIFTWRVLTLVKRQATGTVFAAGHVAATYVVTHNLFMLPVNVTLTATNSDTGNVISTAWVDTITATQFTVNFGPFVLPFDLSFQWSATI